MIAKPVSLRKGGYSGLPVKLRKNLNQSQEKVFVYFEIYSKKMSTRDSVRIFVHVFPWYLPCFRKDWQVYNI